MKYICTQDIENLAAQGKKELILDRDTILLELARDTARILGIEIIDSQRPTQAPPTSRPVPAPALAPSTSSKPRGCQHA